VPAVVGGLTAAAILLAPLGLFHNQSRGTALDIPAVSKLANLGDQVLMLGYEPDIQAVRPGDVLDLTLYWKAAQPLAIDYQVFVHVVDAAGNLVAQSDKLNPGDFPTHRWPVDRYVPDTHRLVLPADLPPGPYEVRTGMWVQSEGWRLPLFDAGGRQVADSALVTRFEVE
jgi:hypothetical protein